MRINDLLIESTNQLDEGPKFNKFGKAIGNVAGMAAKGVGAVAGGIAGLGAAAKKGFQAGKSQVAAADDGAPRKPKGFLAGVKAGQSQGLSAFNNPATDDEDPTAVGAQVTPAGATTAGGIVQPPPTPAAKPQAGATTPPSATDINKAGPKGTAAAKPLQGASKVAAAKTGAALAGQDQAQAGQTMYTQVKANIDKLDKKGKQRILQLLQKSMSAPAAGGAAPAGKPAAGGAMGAMAQQLGAAKPAANTMANAPVSKTNTAKPGNPNAAPASVAPTKPAADPTAPAAPEKAAPGATTPAPSGEKTIANPVATVGTKRASNVGKPTFDTQTGKSLPGQALNNVRKKAEYGTNALGAARKKIKAGAAQPEMASKINTGSLVLEGFSLFRKK